MKIKILLLAIAFVTFESFSGPLPHYVKDAHSPEVASGPTPYHYDSVKVTGAYKFGHAAAAATQAYARIVYPVFANNNLNGIIKKTTLSPLKVNYQFKNQNAATHPALSNMDAINNTATDYKGLAVGFIKQFEIQAPHDERQAYWYADIAVKVITERPDYVAVLCKKDFFTGGLHDLYATIYLNYDVRNRTIFTLESQLKPDKLSQLTIIAERIFRKNENLTPSEELNGYFFANGKFNLPDNFTITSKGLMFFYNYYEIKPFAAGTTQLIIPFSDLKALVMTDSILASYIKKANKA